MDGPPQNTHIPLGRVAERIQNFQRHPRAKSLTNHRSNPPSTVSAEVKPSVPLPEEQQAATEDLVGQSFPSTAISETGGFFQQEHDRGRTKTRLEDHAEPLQDVDHIDETLEDVRSRLYSVQKIVQRSRSGSSQARDDMMDELGTMIDTAIATTMTPLPTPSITTRSLSSKRSSPQKDPSSRSPMSRSYSLKMPSSNPVQGQVVARGQMDAAARTPRLVSTSHTALRRFQKPAVSVLDRARLRQSSEPVTFVPRRTGFPLSSPVRERALLWESMSRSAIAESDSPGSSPAPYSYEPHSTHLEEVECQSTIPSTEEVPEQASPEEQTPKPPSPPIQLALPQLLDAERKDQQQNEGTDNKTDFVQLPSDQETLRSTSIEWPGRLRLAEIGSGSPTVRESVSIAQAAEPDEHHAKPRPSMVKSTIRDLLSATKRKVSGKSANAKTSSKDESSTVTGSELRASIADLDAVDVKHLPAVQANPQEVPFASSTDDSESGTTSHKASLRTSATDHRFDPPRSHQTVSPTKSMSTTPRRGRTRTVRSPNGRPYALDHKFALSPSRSNSKGSRGSLTFSIKARVSPGRGLGKDDTEIFVTANVESDESEEGR